MVNVIIAMKNGNLSNVLYLTTELCLEWTILKHCICHVSDCKVKISKQISLYLRNRNEIYQDLEGLRHFFFFFSQRKECVKSHFVSAEVHAQKLHQIKH